LRVISAINPALAVLAKNFAGVCARKNYPTTAVWTLFNLLRWLNKGTKSLFGTLILNIHVFVV
jgi:hypothetical protein